VIRYNKSFASRRLYRIKPAGTSNKTRGRAAIVQGVPAPPLSRWKSAVMAATLRGIETRDMPQLSGNVTRDAIGNLWKKIMSAI
jgi:hypothetical protein